MAGRSWRWVTGGLLFVWAVLAAEETGAVAAQAPPEARSVLIVDQSISLRTTDPGQGRIKLLRDYIDRRILNASLSGRSIEIGIVDFGGRARLAYGVEAFTSTSNLDALHQAVRVNEIDNTDFRAALCAGWSQVTGLRPPPEAGCNGLDVVASPVAPTGVPLELLLWTDGLPAPRGQDLIFRPSDATGPGLCERPVADASEGHQYMCSIYELWNVLRATRSVSLSVRFYDPTAEQRSWKSVELYWCLMARIGEVCDAKPASVDVQLEPPGSEGASHELCSGDRCSLPDFTDYAIFTVLNVALGDMLAVTSPGTPSSPGEDVLKRKSSQVTEIVIGTTRAVRIDLPQPGVWSVTSSSPRAALNVAVTAFTARLKVEVDPLVSLVGDELSIRAVLLTADNRQLQYLPAAPKTARTHVRVAPRDGNTTTAVYENAATFQYDEGQRVFTQIEPFRITQAGVFRATVSFDLDDRRLALGAADFEVRSPAAPVVKVSWSEPGDDSEWMILSFSPSIGWRPRLSAMRHVRGSVVLVDPETPGQRRPLSTWFLNGAAPTARLEMSSGPKRSGEGLVQITELKWDAETSTLEFDVALPREFGSAKNVTLAVDLDGVLKSGEKWSPDVDPKLVPVKAQAWIRWADGLGYLWWVILVVVAAALVSALAVNTGTMRER